ncbi:hypothetical protein AUP68_06375 [Ilyonectria robusta]
MSQSRPSYLSRHIGTPNTLYPHVHLSKFMHHAEGRDSSLRCTLFQFDEDCTKAPDMIRSDEPKFADHMNQIETRRGSTRSLFILEGLSASWIEKLGSIFDIDPVFFDWQLRTLELPPTWLKYEVMRLPSMRKSDLHLGLVYLEVLEFPDNPPRSSWYLDVGPGIARRVFMQNTRQGPVGLVVRPVSQWLREYPDGCWECQCRGLRHWGSQIGILYRKRYCSVANPEIGREGLARFKAGFY